MDNIKSPTHLSKNIPCYGHSKSSSFCLYIPKMHVIASLSTYSANYFRLDNNDLMILEYLLYKPYQHTCIMNDCV